MCKCFKFGDNWFLTSSVYTILKANHHHNWTPNLKIENPHVEIKPDLYTHTSTTSLYFFPNIMINKFTHSIKHNISYVLIMMIVFALTGNVK
jgi:hypothetical protein